MAKLTPSGSHRVSRRRRFRRALAVALVFAPYDRVLQELRHLRPPVAREETSARSA